MSNDPDADGPEAGASLSGARARRRGAVLSEPGISVQMIEGGHPMMRFEAACATQILGPAEIATLSGKISVSVENLEAARTLRDALSAFLTFQEGVRRRRLPEGECVYCDKYRGDPMMPFHTASARCESGKHPHCTCDTCF